MSECARCEELKNALTSMVQQYLPTCCEDGRYTHDFMSAGEETLGLMAAIGLVRSLEQRWRRISEARTELEVREAAAGGRHAGDAGVVIV